MAGGVITASVMFGLQAAGSGLGWLGQKSQADQANAQRRKQDRHNQKVFQSQEALKDFEHKNALKIHAMRKEQSRLEIQQYQNNFVNYYFDEQMALNDIIENARNSALQSGIKLSQVQGQNLASSTARGVSGRRAGSGGVLAQNAIMAGMEGIQRSRRLVMAEQRQDLRLDRARNRTNLMMQMSHNKIGPTPERAPVGVAPLSLGQDPGPSWMGLGAGLLNAAGSAAGTYASLQPKSPGEIIPDP